MRNTSQQKQPTTWVDDRLRSAPDAGREHWPSYARLEVFAMEWRCILNLYSPPGRTERRVTYHGTGGSCEDALNFALMMMRNDLVDELPRELVGKKIEYQLSMEFERCQTSTR